LAETAPLLFCGPFHLISIIYANSQNVLCNFVAPRMIKKVSSKSDLTRHDREETI